ncbi:MAG TPA: response regulator [Bryobacteraceae bacterium]|nr:response regulator [Bryobacteraceae bacterium]
MTRAHTIHNHATVMVFHSAQVVRTVLREILEREGYLVRATGDLGNAVDMVRESPPDLLLIGVCTGQVNGHDAALYLRGKCPSMRVLMLAGLPTDERVEIWTRGEGFEVFPRPFAPADLLIAVAECLAGERPSQRTVTTTP